MNVLLWLFCATLPCIIQAVFRPPIVVSMQPGGAQEVAPKTERVLCPVVYVSPTLRFRRSLDVVRRSIENEGFRFDPAVCDDIGQRLPVRGQVSLNGGPLQFGFGLRDDETQDLDAEVKSLLRPGSKPRKNLRKFRRNYNLRFGRSLDLQTPCSDCEEEEDKNLYAYSRATTKGQDSEGNDIGDFVMESQPSEKGEPSPSHAGSH
ncbi:uncharacterized protein [Macrobrachium rosenbergii]|uniref:uncharacterized protein n=1 Tax=Macrobrachium rosenbergii TaxID=79674 RepID=UPI0034D4B404